ncbi:hypothetical protein HZS_7021 [Henneguya salminicola]|nr:hypothetical protein HZS_7021 [Henneguya salminicola]
MSETVYNEVVKGSLKLKTDRKKKPTKKSEETKSDNKDKTSDSTKTVAEVKTSTEISFDKVRNERSHNRVVKKAEKTHRERVDVYC